MASNRTSGIPEEPSLSAERVRALSRALVLTGTVAGVVALTLLAMGRVADTRVALVGDDPIGPAPHSDTHEARGAADDAPWDAVPADRTGLAFLRLEDPLERAVATLGHPDERMPDINAAYAHSWRLAPDIEFHVSADDQGITALAAQVPVHPPVRIRAHAGIVIGESTPAQITERWGTDRDVADLPGQDFVLRYIACVGPFPVVIKFDQDPGAPEVRWDEPVTSVLVAYADAEPGTAGCPGP